MFSLKLRCRFVTTAIKLTLTADCYRTNTPIFLGTQIGLCSHWAQYHMQVLPTLHPWEHLM